LPRDSFRIGNGCGKGQTQDHGRFMAKRGGVWSAKRGMARLLTGWAAPDHGGKFPDLSRMAACRSCSPIMLPAQRWAGGTGAVALPPWIVTVRLESAAIAAMVARGRQVGCGNRARLYRQRTFGLRLKALVAADR
jgi:hypothetical protein